MSKSSHQVMVTRVDPISPSSHLDLGESLRTGDEDQRISLNPAHPVAGCQVTISYNFDGSGVTQTKIKVRFFPSGMSGPHTLTPANNAIQIDVPDNAQQVVVEDLCGPSPDLTRSVRPGMCEDDEV